MKRTKSKRKFAWLAGKTSFNGDVEEWILTQYHPGEIGKKYDIVERKRGGIHRIKPKDLKLNI